MKTSIILLLILLMGTACSPQPTAVPLINPNPIPVTGVTPVATDIPAATSVPVCTCPTSMATPTQPPAGFVSPDHIVCNCPIILVPPAVPTSGGGSGSRSGPSAMPAGGITLSDNGKTFLVHPGDSFLLNLGMDTFDWTVTIDNQNVISRERNVMPIRGAQGVYQAAATGQAVLSAEGDPLCRNSTPACMMPSLIFRVTVIVQ
jgi:hypothetical protein